MLVCGTFGFGKFFGLQTIKSNIKRCLVALPTETGPARRKSQYVKKIHEQAVYGRLKLVKISILSITAVSQS